MTREPVLIDDHLLARLLVGEPPRSLRHSGPIFTTGLWYHRLCRSVANPAVTRVISRLLGGNDPQLGAGVARAVIDLPDEIGLVSLRQLSWPMAALVDAGARLNLMSLEALAAAEHLGAEIHLASTDENPPLIAAATGRGVAVRVSA